MGRTDDTASGTGCRALSETTRPSTTRPGSVHRNLSRLLRAQRQDAIGTDLSRELTRDEKIWLAAEAD